MTITVPTEVRYAAARAHLIARHSYDHPTAETRERHIDYDARSYLPPPVPADPDEEYGGHYDRSLDAVMQAVWDARAAEVEQLRALIRTVDFLGTGFIYRDPATGEKLLLKPDDVEVVIGVGQQTERERMAAEVIDLRRQLDTARWADVDAAMVDGQIRLLGNGGTNIADLPGDRAVILRDMLADLIAERASLGKAAA